ncbi:MAG: response regulator [Limisphaerales bacterium]
MTDFTLGSLISVFPGPVLLADAQGKLLACNDAARSFLGSSATLDEGTQIGDFLHLEPTLLKAACPDAPHWQGTHKATAKMGGCAAVRDEMMEITTIPIRLPTNGSRGFLVTLSQPESTTAAVAPVPPGTDPKLAVLQKCAHDLGNVIGIIYNMVECASLQTETEIKATKLISDLTPVSERGLDLVRRLNELLSSVPTVSQRTGTPPKTDSGGSATPGLPARPISMAGTERILLVEDELQYRLLVKAVLGFRGYRVTAAADGTEALKRVAEAAEPFDLLITDFILPDLDGLELFARIRSEQGELKHLVLSGLAPERESEEGIGPVNWLSKPFTNEILLGKVRQILDGR